MSQRWSKVALKGESQRIPRTCPNCLKPSEVENRYCYTRPLPLFLLDRTRYWQTFYYCTGCTETLDAFFKHQRIMGWLWIPGVFAFIGGVIALAIAFSKEGPLAGVGKRLGEEASIGLAAVLIAALFMGFSRLIRSMLRKRHPQQPGQATWGPAAYFVGTWLGLGFGSANAYIAARPEWIKALVELNPDQVDDATYRRVVGVPKPAPEEKRPFA